MWMVIGACVLFTVALALENVLVYKSGHAAGRELATDHWRRKFDALKRHCDVLEHRANGTVRPWMVGPVPQAERTMLRRPQANPRPRPVPDTATLPKRTTTGEFEAVIDQMRAGTYQPRGA